MGSRNRPSLGLYSPSVLMLLQLPTSTIAELTISILPPPPNQILELRQAAPTNDPTIPTDAAPTTAPTPSPTSTTEHQDDDQLNENDTHVFNYYFLLIAIFIAILLLGFIFAGRRRKKRTIRLMQSRHQALRRDVESWPGRNPRTTRNNTGYGPTRWAAGARNWRIRNEAAVTRHDEGLDESGEAPPPYNPGDKPPEISRRASHTSERAAMDDGLAVPLRTLSRGNGGPNPPGYRESVGHNGFEEISLMTRPEEETLITRPDAVVTPTTDRFSSDRRLMERTEGSSH